MPRHRVPPSASVLAEHLGDGRPLLGPLAPVESWLEASAAFRGFVDANRDKIRKKVRLATTADTRLDLRAEIRVASLLLADRRIELQFEAYGSGNRGPDFTATYRGGPPFNLEVTRRHTPGVAGLERTVLGKLRQLPPSVANVLVIALGVAAEPVDLPALMRELRVHADRRDDSFFAARGSVDATTFNQGVLRLAAVVAWQEAGPGSGIATWANPGARIALDGAAVRAIEAALRG